MKKVILFLFLISLFIGNIEAQTKRSSIPLDHGSHRLGKRTDPMMQRWREYGLGQFIHWGIYAIPGGHWNGEYFNGAAEWIRVWNKIPREAYDSLYKQFNPIKFNAKEWANQAANMGAKYMIITTKHHDGFCLWPSKYTNYTVANSPWKKDIVKELVDAYNNKGIDVYLYFSIIDWNHPGYRSSLKTAQDSIEYEKFKEFTVNQLKELLKNYPSVKGLWFDGSWDQAWIAQAAFCDQLEKDLRSMIPGLIIGSRFRADEYGKRHFDSNGDMMGDYEQGWERSMPNELADVKGNDWDCVMTVPENQWGYHSNWKGHVKTPFELVEMLVKAVSLNGNFVLNFGPDGQGAIRKEETEIAAKIGEWMKLNSEAIYGCTSTNYKKQSWGYYTKKEDKVYMIVFNQPLNKKLRLELPKGSTIDSGKCLINGKTVSIISAGKDKSNNALFDIIVPEGINSDMPYTILVNIKNASVGEEYQQAKT